jgi:glycosyltransferase involved in cell wall biosynthesis
MEKQMNREANGADEMVETRDRKRAADPRVVVLIPCYNEEQTVARVVAAFRRELPAAEIVVYDNNSTDGARDAAMRAGALVRQEPRRGKGNVLRAMFREVDADVCVVVDGDDTYPAEAVRDLIAPVTSGEADMVVGTRVAASEAGSFRRFHRLGNRLIVGIMNALFGTRLTDVLSGYRAFSSLFVKGMPMVSAGFEVEIEMTGHALDKAFRVVEIPIRYRPRPPGSVSKLNTFRDGALALLALLRLLKDYRPLQFFSILSLALVILAFALGVPVVFEFLATGLVPRFPTAILSSALIILGFLMFSVGLILSTIDKHYRENYELWVKSLLGTDRARRR